MDERTSIILASLLFGGLIAGVGVFGLISGKAYFPPRARWETGQFVRRSEERGAYWAIAITQTLAGIVLGTLPWWRF